MLTSYGNSIFHINGLTLNKKFFKNIILQMYFIIKKVYQFHSVNYTQET